MSVMKLNAEEYLYLSKFLGTLNLKNDAFAEEVLLNENIYNVVRNLNVLGLCERYNDLFAESWANNNEEYKEIYSKYYSFDDISNEKILSSGRISEKDINNPKELLGHLLYNSFSNNHYYSERIFYYVSISFFHSIFHGFLRNIKLTVYSSILTLTDV